MVAQGMEKSYLCIDLKSFYASVECADPRHEGARGEEPLPRVRDSQRHRVHNGNAEDASVHGGVGRDQRHLHALRQSRGHARLLH